MAMTDQYERRWEDFSDRLSEALDDVAETHDLSPEAIDTLHLATVRVFLENSVNIVKQRLVAKPLSYALH